jgi:hypothetical protein
MNTIPANDIDQAGSARSGTLQWFGFFNHQREIDIELLIGPFLTSFDHPVQPIPCVTNLFCRIMLK